MASRNIKLTLSYDGNGFHGWQVQPGKPTIQGVLAETLERIVGEKVAPQASGRTDAGVHALAQVAHFHTSSSIPSENLRKALNSCLPESIRVLEAKVVPDDFHSRRDAKAKTYRYRLFIGEVCPPFLAGFVTHHPYPLRLELMARAAALVVGEHDFTSFAAVDPEKRTSGAATPASNVRRILASTWEAQGEEFIYTVRGKGFLHHMVRNLVGIFLMVGKGNMPPEDVSRILKQSSRSAAGPTAPAQGLYLVSVEY